MKKIFPLFLALPLLLAGCAPAEVSDGFRVAIVQQMDHASLDEIRAAVEAELDAIAAETGVPIEYRVFNGQNDATVLNQIGTQVVSGGYDAIIPIATLAAQCMVTAADGTVPVIYAAISDPEGAGLTGLPNVTGTCDALDTAFLLDMMRTADPALKTVGLLYSNSEVNSAAPIAAAKACLDSLGITWIEKTGSTADEILIAASSLVGRVDAVFTPTDNVVMAAENAVAEILNEAGIPHYCGADAFVAAGAFAACGVDYTGLGRATARLAAQVLLDGEVPPYQTVPGGILTVNAATAGKLGLDPAVFAGMGQIVQIIDGD